MYRHLKNPKYDWTVNSLPTLNKQFFKHQNVDVQGGGGGGTQIDERAGRGLSNSSQLIVESSDMGNLLPHQLLGHSLGVGRKICFYTACSRNRSQGHFFQDCRDRTSARQIVASLLGTIGSLQSL